MRNGFETSVVTVFDVGEFETDVFFVEKCKKKRIPTKINNTTFKIRRPFFMKQLFCAK